MKSLDYSSLLNNFSKFQNSNFLNRYIGCEKLEMYLKEEIFPIYKNEVIGYSELDNPIYSIDLGNGSKKVLLWSQMHGNESTTTKAILDFLNYVKLNERTSFVDYLLKSCHVKIIPILNPDGATKYTRFNANEVDLNRDAVKRSQKETRHFFKCLEAFKPDYCFNMHGQRSIFSAGNQNKPASLSFLAPSYNKELSMNKSREKSMQLILAANQMLSEFIPDQIGRYDDAHNPNCFGDQIQNIGIPTILFEAGHYRQDYDRNTTRKYVTLSLIRMLESIMYSDFDRYDSSDYFKIPENKELYLDIIINNVTNTASGFIGIQFNEILEDNKISFKPYIKRIDDLSHLFAHRSIDAEYKPVEVNGDIAISPDEYIQNLRIGNRKVDF